MDVTQFYDNNNYEHKVMLKRVFEEFKVNDFLWKPMALAIHDNKIPLYGLKCAVKQLLLDAPTYASFVDRPAKLAWKRRESPIKLCHDFLRYCAELLPDEQV